MKAGEVVTIRVPPEDMITCLDICERNGLALYGASLSQIVRLALSSLCAHAREAGLAPTHEGFDYLQRVGPYKLVKQEVKLSLARGLEQVQSHARAQDLPTVLRPLSGGAAKSQLDVSAPEYKRKQARMRELQFKLRADPLNRDPSDQQEFDRLFDEGVRP